MAKRHEGKTMLVTGAAGAIGFATCRILAEEGARVMLVDIDDARLKTRTAELKAAGHDAIAFHADCAEEPQVKAYAQAALDAFRHVDGFFNNAGIEGTLAPTHEYDVAEFDHVLHVNLRGMFLGLRHVLPAMVARGRGAVVNTASIGSERGLAGACASVSPWRKAKARISASVMGRKLARRATCSLRCRCESSPAPRRRSPTARR